MKSYFVYILKCSDGSYYTGITNDLDRRVAEHNEGNDTNAFVYKRRPVKLVWYTSYGDVRNAIALEKKLKGWNKRKKEALIRGDFNALPNLSKKKF